MLEEEPEIRLMLAGSGPLEEELRARELKNAEFLGFKSGDELCSLISGAAATVCPSQWYENCPMSVIESLTLGTPVITCDIGGTREMIENGVNGLIYKADDKAALKNAIKTVYNDDELTAKMKKHCREFPVTLNVEDYSKKILEIYSEVL